MAFTDPVPAGITIVSIAGAQNDCSASTPATVACTVGTLAPGASAQVTLTATAAGSLGGSTVENVATATSVPPDPNLANNTSRVPVAVQRVVDLKPTKTIAPAAPIAGGPVTYTIGVADAGPRTATGVVIDDAKIPAVVQVATASVTSGGGSCQVGTGGVRCALADIPAGGSAAVRISGTVKPDAAGQSLTNGVYVTAAETRVAGHTETSTTNVTARPGADLRIRKLAPRPVPVGSVAAFRLRVRNLGPSTAQGVVVTDTLPKGLKPLLGKRVGDGVRAVRARGARCEGRGRAVACSIPSLAAGRTRTIRRPVRFTAAGNYRNSVRVTSLTPDPNLRNNRDRVRVRALKLHVSKTADRRVAATGSRVHCRITVRNRGKTVRGVDVCDRLPRRLILASAPGARTKRHRACWNDQTFARGATRRFSVTARAAGVGSARRVANRVTGNGHPTARRVVTIVPSRPQFTG